MSAETNAELLLTMREFRTALRAAAHNLTLEQFAEAIDNDVDDYARDKWRDLIKLGDLLAWFSASTLERLVLYERTHRP